MEPLALQSRKALGKGHVAPIRRLASQRARNRFRGAMAGLLCALALGVFLPGRSWRGLAGERGSDTSARSRSVGNRPGAGSGPGPRHRAGGTGAGDTASARDAF